mgnify:CR=1 FL=1
MMGGNEEGDAHLAFNEAFGIETPLRIGPIKAMQHLGIGSIIEITIGGDLLRTAYKQSRVFAFLYDCAVGPQATQNEEWNNPPDTSNGFHLLYSLARLYQTSDVESLRSFRSKYVEWLAKKLPNIASDGNIEAIADQILCAHATLCDVIKDKSASRKEAGIVVPEIGITIGDIQRFYIESTKP